MTEELGNPYQLLTLVVAPAMLTNASALLSLSTSNRFARTVDRARELYEKLQKPDKLTADEKSLYKKQLELIGARSMFQVRAMNCFYLSVGSFAATSFVSILGAVISSSSRVIAAEVVTILSLVVGLMGVTGLLWGSALLVREKKLTESFLKYEVELAEKLLAQANV